MAFVTEAAANRSEHEKKWEKKRKSEHESKS